MCLYSYCSASGGAKGELVRLHNSNVAMFSLWLYCEVRCEFGDVGKDADLNASGYGRDRRVEKGGKIRVGGMEVETGMNAYAKGCRKHGPSAFDIDRQELEVAAVTTITLASILGMCRW